MLSLRPRDDGVLRDSSRPVRTRSRDVTRGNGVGLLAENPWWAVRSAWSSRRGYLGACRDAGGFQSVDFLRLDRPENARALDKNEGREHLSLLETDSKAENTLCLLGSERKNREHPCSFEFEKEIVRMAVAESIRATSCPVAGTNLVLIVSRRAVLYSRPGFRVVAARSGLCQTRGAKCVRRAFGTLGVEHARCGRGSRDAMCARCGRGTSRYLQY